MDATETKITQWKFNINNSVRVKLKEKGYQRLADLHNKYLGQIKNWERRSADYYKQKADKEGYTKFQMWTFMEYFGAVTFIGMNEYYGATIVIDADSLEPFNS